MMGSIKMERKNHTNNLSSSGDLVTIIKPKSGWQFIDFKELKEYRDLFFFMVWREIKVLYAQTILGFSWAILNPLVQIVIFTIIFGKVAKVPSEGIPYFLFSSVAIIPWTYMSQSMSQSAQSLVQGQHMLGKVYFPRLIFPTDSRACQTGRFWDFYLNTVGCNALLSRPSNMEPVSFSIIFYSHDFYSRRYWYVVICYGHSIS